MKLIDLHPRWIGAGGEGIFDRDGRPVPEQHGVGVMFDCPCGKCDPETDPIYIPFENPLDGSAKHADGYGWKRTGDTFETLTLAPSILSAKERGGCGWHGYVRNGEIINA